MKAPLFLPAPVYVPRLSATGAMALRTLCRRADVDCKASGAWTQRPIVVRRGDYAIAAEPGGYGVVRTTVPAALSKRDAARHALVLLAYSLFDGVARATVAGQPWSRPAKPPGRRALGMAKSNAERQRAWRARHASGRV